MGFLWKCKCWIEEVCCFTLSIYKAKVEIFRGCRCCMYSYNHDFSPFIQRELILLAVLFWQVFVLMENYCIMCLYLCMHMIFTNTATSAEIFTCIITFLSPVLISFKIEYICILQEWWTTRFKHVVKWLRWLVGLSGQAVWQTVRGLCTGTCWWIALHIFTLTFKSEKCQC